MDYKSFEYMRKTLPNEFNWSILYQLFSEDEIELSETAENYLRTTPWNTNLTIFEEILEAGEGGQSDKAILYLNGGYFGEDTFEDHIDKSRSTIMSLNDLWTWCMEHNIRTVTEREFGDTIIYDIVYAANDIEVYLGDTEYGVDYKLVTGPALHENGAKSREWTPDETSMWNCGDLPGSDEYFWFNKTKTDYNYLN